MQSANAVLLISMAQFVIYATVSNVVDAGSNICVGQYHTCFVNSAKSLYCWGSNADGQVGLSTSFSSIGDGTGEMKSLTAISTNVDEVTCGSDHTCFLSSGNVYCFGKNTDSQLGLGSSSSHMLYDAKSSKLSLTSVNHVSSYRVATCASTSDSIYCWGLANSIDISFGTYVVSSSLPTKIAGPLSSAPSQISVGDSHACYLLTNGTAYCWGDNSSGQLGVGFEDPLFPTPTRVAITSSLSSISVGYAHTCVVYSGSNKIACFGNNFCYQLGDGTRTSRGTSSSDMSTLLSNSLLGTGTPFPGYLRTCLVRSTDSGIYCIGSNTGYSICNRDIASQIGSSTADYPPNYKLPVPLTSSITLALGSGTHQCATNGVDVYCWGTNQYGQLGTESLTSIYTCSSTSSFKKACVGTTCSSPPTPCYNCSVDILPFIPAIVVLSIMILAWIVLTCIGCRKRKEFDARVFLHPNGTQISGGKIWASYTRPLGPRGAIPQTTQPASAYAITEPVATTGVIDSTKTGYLSNV